MQKSGVLLSPTAFLMAVFMAAPMPAQTKDKAPAKGAAPAKAAAKAPAKGALLDLNGATAPA